MFAGIYLAKNHENAMGRRTRVAEMEPMFLVALLQKSPEQ
jgi:hypothetical protein